MSIQNVVMEKLIKTLLKKYLEQKKNYSTFLKQILSQAQYLPCILTTCYDTVESQDYRCLYVTNLLIDIKHSTLLITRICCINLFIMKAMEMFMTNLKAFSQI